jgi:hypothetical protein
LILSDLNCSGTIGGIRDVVYDPNGEDTDPVVPASLPINMDVSHTATSITFTVPQTVAPGETTPGANVLNLHFRLDKIGIPPSSYLLNFVQDLTGQVITRILPINDLFADLGMTLRHLGPNLDCASKVGTVFATPASDFGLDEGNVLSVCSEGDAAISFLSQGVIEADLDLPAKRVSVDFTPQDSEAFAVLTAFYGEGRIIDTVTSEPGVGGRLSLKSSGIARVWFTGGGNHGVYFHGVVVIHASGSRRFRRGDANQSGFADVSDVIFTLEFLFLGVENDPLCLKSLDIDDSAEIDLTDVLAMLDHLFLGNETPSVPYNYCGSDPTPDGVSCESFTVCE